MFRRKISAPRFHGIASVTAALPAIVALALSGCGERLEFDKAVGHSPESLVQEFMIRYQGLPDQATAKQQARAAKEAEARAKLPDVDAGSLKSSRKEAAVKSQALSQTQTLDNLLDALDRRLGSVEGLSRKEAAAKAVELINNEPDIRDEDRKVVIERLSR